MSEICPLVFEPIFRPKVWGGRNLARIFSKSLPESGAIGESWECADLENGQSVVARGPAKGLTLHALVDEWGEGLIGGAKLSDGRFPLLIKFLDAVENLSIQVHPIELAAMPQSRLAQVKHEAWHIIDAAPGAFIYRGLLPGSNIKDLLVAVRSRPAAILDFLTKIPVKAGQTYFLPSGTPHALGAGTVVAEIQTPSDVTYRLYDWDRTRPDSDAGLHLEDGLTNIQSEVDFQHYEKRSHVTNLFTTVSRLVACPSFVIEKVRFIGELEQEIPYAEMVCWIMTEGKGELLFGPSGVLAFGKGDVIILPAHLENPRVRTLTDCSWLEVTIPVESDLSAFSRPDSAELRTEHGTRPISLNISVKKPPVR